MKRCQSPHAGMTLGVEPHVYVRAPRLPDRGVAAPPRRPVLVLVLQEEKGQRSRCIVAGLETPNLRLARGVDGLGSAAQGWEVKPVTETSSLVGKARPQRFSMCGLGWRPIRQDLGGHEVRCRFYPVGGPGSCSRAWEGSGRRECPWAPVPRMRWVCGHAWVPGDLLRSSLAWAPSLCSVSFGGHPPGALSNIGRLPGSRLREPLLSRRSTWCEP